jgi:hypothetical protein
MIKILYAMIKKWTLYFFIYQFLLLVARLWNLIKNQLEKAQSKDLLLILRQSGNIVQVEQNPALFKVLNSADLYCQTELV